MKSKPISVRQILQRKRIIGVYETFAFDKKTDTVYNVFG